MNNWYVEHNGQRLGPMTLEAMRQMAASGQIAPTDLVWGEGMPTWQRADTQPWFTSLVRSTPPPPPASPLPSTTLTGGAVEAEPPSLTGWSIAVLLCCCMPGGIAGLIYGSKAKTEYAKGNYQAARAAYETAKKWLIWSAILGAIINIGYLAAKLSEK